MRLGEVVTGINPDELSSNGVLKSVGEKINAYLKENPLRPWEIDSIITNELREIRERRKQDSGKLDSVLLSEINRCDPEERIRIDYRGAVSLYVLRKFISPIPTSFVANGSGKKDDL